MKPVAALVLVALCAVGCGGGGTGSSSSVNQSGQNQMAVTLPAVTTTYTGTISNGSGTVFGTVVIVVQPNGSMTLTPTITNPAVASTSLANPCYGFTATIANKQVQAGISTTVNAGAYQAGGLVTSLTSVQIHGNYSWVVPQASGTGLASGDVQFSGTDSD